MANLFLSISSISLIFSDLTRHGEQIINNGLNDPTPLTLLIVFTGGLLTSFGPCSLSLLPITVAYLTLKISLNCRNNYSKLISIGSGTILVGQSIMHIAVSSGAMPTTGLPFPLISYGGNSLISSLLIAALLVRCSIESSDLLVKNSSN